MQGSRTHIPGTNHVPRGYIVSAILSLLFMVPLCLVPALLLLLLSLLLLLLSNVSFFPHFLAIPGFTAVLNYVDLPVITNTECAGVFGS